MLQGILSKLLTGRFSGSERTLELTPSHTRILYVRNLRPGEDACVFGSCVKRGLQWTVSDAVTADSGGEEYYC